MMDRALADGAAAERSAVDNEDLAGERVAAFGANRAAQGSAGRAEGDLKLVIGGMAGLPDGRSD
jgi:hypothetical protein